MKLIYIANNRLPTEKAHGIQIAKMCEAFSSSNIDIELIYPMRKNRIKDGFFDYYGIDKPRDDCAFKLIKLWSIDLVGVVPVIGFWIQGISFTKMVVFYLFLKKYSGIIYSRDQFSALVLSFFKRFNVVFELHSLPSSVRFYHKIFYKKIHRFVVISNGLKKDLVRFGVDENNVLVAPDGVDLKEFNISDEKMDIRERLNLPKDKKIILYSGHLYKWKGAEILLDAASNLKDILFVFVGGTKKDTERFKKKAGNMKLKNTLIIGHRPRKDIPFYLKSADLLMLPNSGKEKISSHYTSPLKLFEYMASGVPILASDLPSIREILNNDNAIFFNPDNSTDLTRKIERCINDNDFLDEISRESLQDVRQYSWILRARKIIDFFNKKC